MGFYLLQREADSLWFVVRSMSQWRHSGVERWGKLSCVGVIRVGCH